MNARTLWIIVIISAVSPSDLSSLRASASAQSPSVAQSNHEPDAAPNASKDGSAPVEWIKAAPGYPWSFPRDHHAHSDYAVEWWYLTGHLEAPDDRRFGYQFTLFRVGTAPGDAPNKTEEETSRWRARGLVMGHASITDITNGEHLFSDVIHRASPLLGGFPPPVSPRLGRDDSAHGLLAWCRGPAGTKEEWTIAWNGDGFDIAMTDTRLGIALALKTRPTKPMVFHGPGGYSQKNFAGTSASQYYSFTRLQTSGEITFDGVSTPVTGQSWMDKEFSSDQLDENQTGWDWFSLQLDDGRELMLYVLRESDGGTGFARGTLVQADGTTLPLDPSDWVITQTSSFRSERTGAVYPSRWKIELKSHGLTLEVTPELDRQENVSRSLSELYYWEGAVRVLGPAGDRIGHGYVELTGYGGSRLPL